MRILLLISRFDMTGLTTNTLDLFDGLRSIEYDVWLLVGRPDTIPSNGVKRFYEKYKEGKQDDGGTVIYYNDLGCSNKFIGLLKIMGHILKINPDIIHSESPYYTFIPWMLHKKFVTTMHVTDIFPINAYKKGNHVIAISKETRLWAINRLGHKPEDVSIVFHGVSERFASPIGDDVIKQVKAKHDIPKDKIVIGLVASVEKRKGHDILLNAISSLPDDIKERVHILFVGSSKSGDSNEWLLDCIKDNGLESQTTWVQYTDPLAYYQLIDIFVLPSYQEGFPLVVIEAMMSGCCVMRTDSEGATEQIEDGIDGFVFDRGDVSSLASLLEKVVRNDNLRKCVAAKGKQKALRQFTIAEMAKNTMNVYKKVLNNK